MIVLTMARDRVWRVSGEVVEDQVVPTYKIAHHSNRSIKAPSYCNGWYKFTVYNIVTWGTTNNDNVNTLRVAAHSISQSVVLIHAVHRLPWKRFYRRLSNTINDTAYPTSSPNCWVVGERTIAFDVKLRTDAEENTFGFDNEDGEDHIRQHMKICVAA